MQCFFKALLVYRLYTSFLAAFQPRIDNEFRSVHQFRRRVDNSTTLKNTVYMYIKESYQAASGS